ncbi:MAG: MarR family winged helix-turn-helix transcriptional regulator [Thermoleophilia bacterium]
MASEHRSAWDSPGFLLWHATLRWQRAMRAALAPHGLTHVQFVLLASTWWLCEHGDPPTQRRLADHAGTDPMMTSQVVRALAKQGLVEREPAPDDARAVRVRITTAGRELAIAAVRDVEAADRGFFAAVHDDRLVPRLRTLAGRTADGAPAATSDRER